MKTAIDKIRRAVSQPSTMTCVVMLGLSAILAAVLIAIWTGGAS